MIAYIKGKLLFSENNTAIIENNGLGYELLCSTSLIARLVKDGGGEAYTYLAVREDGVSLYGFDSLAEKNMFLKLISVSGVGPKMGITVLSSASLNDLALYIASSDVKSLSKIKGLGKKTAERIIVELREELANVPVQSIVSAEVSAPLTGDGENAVLALMSLGYNRTESSKAVQKAVEAGFTKLEEIIANALRFFA